MTKLLKFTLFLTGVAMALIGASVGFGGIRTLGFQIEPDFVEAIKPDIFAIQDNHIRFLGGVFTVMGFTTIMGAFRLQALRSVLLSICAVVAVAGLFRFSAGPGFLTNPELLPSFLLEIVYFPLLAFWISRSDA